MKPVPLPVDRVLPEIETALTHHGVVVVGAPTGSGKTTRIPPFLADRPLCAGGRVVVLQPRRVAARACARIMAQMRGEALGASVGYHIRFERCSSAATKLLVVTEGILGRMFAADPMLEDVSCVVLDEFHERSLHTDLALAFLKELRAVREDLKVVVMSATLDAAPISAYFDDCPVVTAEGRRFPLRIEHLDVALADPLEVRVAHGLRALLDSPDDDGGHILVFLPGAGEIRRTQRHLATRDWGAEVVPLHGGLSSADQDAALAPGTRRRIILATNIAETSLTIEGVTAVVDTGYHKMMLHDAVRGTDRLDRVRISAASADQRAGRAGRTAPGRVIRLWSREVQVMLPAADAPEIMRADLTSKLLEVLDFHGPDLDGFPWFTRPAPEALARALHTLQVLGALDAAGRLSELGRRLAALPLHPRRGAVMDAAAARGRTTEAATLLALMEAHAPQGEADLFAQYEDYTSGRRDRWDRRTLTTLAATIKQLRGSARDGGARPTAPFDVHEAGRLLLLGFADRLCRGKGVGFGVMVGGRGVSYEGGHTAHSYFLALELVERGQDRTTGKADRWLPVRLEDITAVLPVVEEADSVYDEAREAVNGVRRLRFQDLVLRERPDAKVPADALAAALAREAAARFDLVFRPDPAAAALLQRLRFAALHLGEYAWPDVSEDGLKAQLPTLCAGLRKFDALRRLDWGQALTALLPWELRGVLEREVPAQMEVPSGSRIRIDYAEAFTDTGFPVLAVRLQEMFGMADTPRVAKGRVPLLCQLLAPNMRPAQVTRDLRNFWNVTYAEVRKELRRRYPKHSWPEDPWTAQAVRGVARKRPKA